MTDMKMNPILFSTIMVQAILEGRKTQTRRVCKPLCVEQTGKDFESRVDYDRLENVLKAGYVPAYTVGDILWVRETWQDICACPLQYAYRADGESVELSGLWKPSIFMPKVAARIFLKVIDVRVERLQSITYGDCCAEGVFNNEDMINASYGQEATEKWRNLWNSINEKRGYGWDTNPFVWVYEFERIDTNG